MAYEVRVRPDRLLPSGEAVVDPLDPRDKPLVVWGGIPGEEALVRVVHEGRNQVVGQVVRPLGASRYRVEPPCGKADPCGGCPLMHLSPDGQRRAREELVQAALASEGLGDVALAGWHPSPGGLADFRHVVKVGFGRSDIGRIRVGAWGRGSRRIVPIPDCIVASPGLNRAMVVLAHHAIDLDIWPYDEETGRGTLRAAVLRQSHVTGEILVTLVSTRKAPHLKELADRIAEGAAQVSGVWLHLNKEPGNAIFARGPEGGIGVLPLLGKAFIEEDIGGIRYRVGPGDFFQTNPAMAAVLYERVVARLAPGAEDAVLDLYCGVGGIALPAARRSGWALGIEEVEGAVSRARENARLNGVSAEFQAGRVEDVLPDVQRRLRGVRPLVNVNPARRGLEDGVVDALLALSPRRITYVSCNPRAMARDLARFRRGGMKVGEVELFDMFPNTPHVEALVTLEGPEAEETDRRAPRRRVVR